MYIIAWSKLHLSGEAAYILHFLHGGQMVTSCPCSPNSPTAYILPPSCASLLSSLPLRFLLHAFFKSLAEELSLYTLLLNRSKSWACRTCKEIRVGWSSNFCTKPWSEEQPSFHVQTARTHPILTNLGKKTGVWDKISTLCGVQRFVCILSVSEQA